MVEKQRVYVSILGLVIRHMRWVEEFRSAGRVLDHSYLPELQLIHGLPVKIARPEIDHDDVGWITMAVAKYLDESVRTKPSDLFPSICDQILKLYKSLPDDLKELVAENSDEIKVIMESMDLEGERFGR